MVICCHRKSHTSLGTGRTCSPQGSVVSFGTSVGVSETFVYRDIVP